MTIIKRRKGQTLYGTFLSDSLHSTTENTLSVVVIPPQKNITIYLGWLHLVRMVQVFVNFDICFHSTDEHTIGM